MSAPWRTPEHANLGLATLRTVLLDDGIECDALHATLLFPTGPSKRILRHLYASFMSLPWLHPEVSYPEAVDLAIRTCLAEMKLQGGRFPPEEARFEDMGYPQDELRAHWAADIQNSETCLSRCAQFATSIDYDVISLSCTP